MPKQYQGYFGPYTEFPAKYPKVTKRPVDKRQFGKPVEFSHTSKFAKRVADKSPQGVGRSWEPLQKELIEKAKNLGSGLKENKCTKFEASGTATRGYLFGPEMTWLGTLSSGNNDQYGRLTYRAKCCLKSSCDKGTLKCRVRFDLRDLYAWEKSEFMSKRGKDYWQIVHFDKELVKNNIKLGGN